MTVKVLGSLQLHVFVVWRENLIEELYFLALFLFFFFSKFLCDYKATFLNSTRNEPNENILTYTALRSNTDALARLKKKKSKILKNINICLKSYCFLFKGRNIL